MPAFCGHNKEAIRKDKTGYFWAREGAQNGRQDWTQERKPCHGLERQAKVSIMKASEPLLLSWSLLSHGKTVKNRRYLKPGNPSVAGITDTFYVFWGSELGSHACVTSSSLIKPSP